MIFHADPGLHLQVEEVVVSLRWRWWRWTWLTCRWWIGGGGGGGGRGEGGGCSGCSGSGGDPFFVLRCKNGSYKYHLDAEMDLSPLTLGAKVLKGVKTHCV